MNDELIKKLTKVLEKVSNNEGIFICLSKNFNKKTFNLREEFKKDNIEINIEGKYLNDYLFIYTFIDMLKNNEIEVKFNDNATKRQIEYVNKLIVK